MATPKQPLVLAALLKAIRDVLKLGIPDLSLLHARLLQGGIVQYKEGRRWVSLRVEYLDSIIAALEAEGKAQRKKQVK